MSFHSRLRWKLPTDRCNFHRTFWRFLALSGAQKQRSQRKQRTPQKQTAAGEQSQAVASRRKQLKETKDLDGSCQQFRPLSVSSKRTQTTGNRANSSRSTPVGRFLPINSNRPIPTVQFQPLNSGQPTLAAHLRSGNSCRPTPAGQLQPANSSPSSRSPAFQSEVLPRSDQFDRRNRAQDGRPKPAQTPHHSPPFDHKATA